ncbi:hypothetical protein [Caballeronia insecticola]|uniref:hypothetical protein n=1 Tax=Caballeronia insecticola TaxID=758793 RepID=UPI0005C5188D|nr:hypothetical protein [Caballeronia insecticola]
MANHATFKIEQALVQHLDTSIARVGACNRLSGFVVRVSASGAITLACRYLDPTGKAKRVTVGR